MDNSPFTSVQAALDAAGGLSAPIPQQKQAEVASTASSKIADVAAASDAKKVEMGGLPDSQTFLNAAITKRTGSGLTSAGPIEKDLSQLSPDQLIAKYGPEQGQAMIDGLNHAGKLYDAKTNTIHTVPEMIGDTALDLGRGLTSIGSTVPLVAALEAKGMTTLGGLGLPGATTLGHIVGGLATESSQDIQGVSDWLGSLRSDSIQAQDEANASKTALDMRDADAIYAQDPGFVAGLKRIGSQAASTIENQVQNPDLLLSNAAQFTGSLLGVGPEARMLKGIADFAVPAATRLSIASEAAIAKELGIASGSRVAAAIGKKLPSAGATSLGLVEAASTNQGNMNDVSNMSQEDLDKNPIYQKLIAQGIDPEDARNQMAINSGLTAAAVAGPLAMAVGKATGSKFADQLMKNPLGYAGHLVPHMLKEAVHEGGLGVTDTLASNIGTKTQVDPDKDLSDDVGAQLGNAALGGFLSTGAMGAPKATAKLALKAGSTAVNAVVGTAAKAASKVVQARTDKANAQVDAQVAQAGAAEQVQAQDPATRTILDTAVAQAPPDKAPVVQTLADKILSRGQFDLQEMATSTLPDTIKAQLWHSTSRVDMLQKLAELVRAKGPDTSEGLAAASFLNDQIEQHYTTTNVDPAAFEALPDDSPAGKLNLEYNNLSNRVSNSPAISEAFAKVRGLTQDQVSKLIQPVTEESLTTPEGQQNVINAAMIAALAPDRGNLEVNRNIVDLADKGKLTLTTNQIGALRASVALMQASKDANEAQAPLGHQKPINSVSNAIISNDGPKGNQLSAAKFTSNIYEAMKSGDKEKAAGELSRFGEFVQHMQNKLIAINAHYSEGGGEKVANTARNAETGVWYQTKGQARQSVIPTNPNSVEYAQKVAIEAKQLSDVYNGLSKAFPTLKGGQHVSETLAKGLQGPLKEVVKAHAKGGSLAERSPSSLVQTLAKPGQSDKLTTTRTIKAAKDAQDIEAKPKSDLEKVLSMSEDEYIKTLNPTGKRIPDDTRGMKEAFDEWHQGVKENGLNPEVFSKQKTVNGVDYYTDDKDGGKSFIHLALKDGQVVGVYGALGHEIITYVPPNMRGKGIGRQLAMEFTRRHPLAAAKSQTVSGEANSRSAFRALKAEQAEATPGAKSPEAISDEGAKAKAAYVRKLVDILKGSAKNSRADLNKLNGHLDRLPEEDVQRAIEEVNGHSVVFNNPVGEAKSAIAKVVNDLAKRMGTDSLTKFARMIVAVTYANGKANAGTYYRTGSFIGVSQRFLDALNAGTASLDQLARFISHEISHAIDFHAATTGREISEDLKFDEVGKLWREFLELKHTDLPEDVARPAFDYIEGHAAQGDAQSFRSEFFAELGSFVLLNPALAKELIPNGTAAFENAFRSAADHVGWPEARLMDLRPDGDLQARSESEAEQSPAKSEPAAESSSSTTDTTSSEPKSRISPEQLARLDDDGLTRRIEANQDKVENDEASPEDEATLKALTAEADRRAKEAETESPKTLLEAYPHLIGSKEGEKVTNWFLKAFRIAKNVQSRLLGQANPAKALQKAFSSQAAYEKFAGKSFGTTAPQAVFDGYRDFLNAIEPLKARMNKALADKLGEVGEKLLDGKDYNSSRFGRVFNLLERQKDGSYIYNDKLVEQALIAALQWLMVSDNYESTMDASQVNSLTSNVIATEDVTPTDIATLNRGLSPEEAVQSLATKIAQYWGVKANGDVPIGHTQGIPLAMAGNILVALREQGLLKQTRFAYTKEKGVNPEPIPENQEGKLPTHLIRIESTQEKFDKKTKVMKPIFMASTLIEQAVLTEPDKPIYYSDDKVPVAPTQMNNPFVKNTKKGKQAIRVANSQEYRLNERMYALYHALSLDRLQDLFGGGSNLDKRVLNDSDRKSREGQNTMVRTAFEAITNRVAEMGMRDESNEGKNLFNVVIHYAHNMSSVNRLQQLGGQTPQGNKMVREAFLPTWSTGVDVRPEGEHYRVFRLAIAQALGIKIGQKYQEQIDSELDDKLAKLSGTIQMLQDHLDDGVIPNDFVSKIQANFKSAGVDEVTPAAFHALQEYARWRSSGDNARANFDTALYVEADGITNGVANALNMFASSPTFSKNEVDNMASGGRFMNGTKTMNDFRQRGGKDLYTVGMNNTESALEALRKHEGEDSPVVMQQNHVLDLLSKLGVKGITLNEATGELRFDRGLTKNPMTITLYGSGAKGIAGNIAHAMADLLYEKLSEAAQAMSEDKDLSLAQAMWGSDARHNDFIDTLNGLIQATISKDRNSLVVHGTGLAPVEADLDPIKSVFDKDQMKAIQANILYTLVGPMVDGITKTLGPSLMTSIKLVQSATQAQSISLEHQFKDLVRERQEERTEDQGYHKEDGLSEDDLKNIMEELLETHPLVETEDQNFFPVHDSQSEMTGASASSLGGEFRTNARVHGPADGGVKGLSMLNQGMGDGNMILRMMNNQAKGLPVFDGFNFGLDQVVKGSQIANQAAHESWQGNPQRAVLNSFKVFVNSLTASKIKETPGLMEALAKALIPPREREFASPLDVIIALERMRNTLSRNADVADARSKVLDGIESFSDNMAGAAEPYHHPGDVLTGSSANIADELNKRLNKKTPSVELEQPSVSEMNRDAAPFQSPDFGSDDRITDLNTKFDQILGRYMKHDDPLTQAKRPTAMGYAMLHAVQLAHLASVKGFYSMTVQKTKAFTSIVGALALDMKLDTASLAAADRIYRTVIKQFHPGLLEDPNDPDQVSRENNAALKYDFLTGNAGTLTDAQGRTSLLPVFLGLAAVDDTLRSALANLELPKSELSHEGTIESRIENLVTQGLDSFASKMAGQGKAKNVRDAIDAMTSQMAKEALDTQSMIQNVMGMPGRGINAANDGVVQLIDSGSKWIVKKSQKAQASQNATVKKIAQVTEFFGKMATAEGGAQTAEMVMHALNKTVQGKSWRPVHDIVADILGRIPSNAGVYDLIKIGRALVQQARQQFVDQVPGMIRNQFSHDVPKAAWSALHMMARADTASLTEGRTHDEVLNLVAKPASRAKAIQDYESELKAMDPKHFTKVQAKAKQLAEHMVTGTTGTNLLRNAEAIAELLNEKQTPGRKMPGKAYVDAIDQLVTLYALNKLSPGVQAHLTSLVQNESKGMAYALAYNNQLRLDEKAKSQGMAKYNANKGYIPSHPKLGVNMIIAKDSDRVALEQKSYVRFADYKGSKAEASHDKRGYYFLPVQARAPFTQGIVQNIQHSAGGVDLQTGASTSLHAGIIDNPVTVKRITQRLATEGNQTNENLIPIFNEHKRIVAYERSLDQSQLSGLDRDTDFGRMMGAWRGRQIEEVAAQQFNVQSVDKLREMYDADMAKSSANIKAYIDLNDPKSYDNDPIIKDAMSLMTPETRAYIKEVFGEHFMVRRDMVKDVIGERKASIGDAWTGTSRWSPEIQNGVKNISLAIMGNNAYKILQIAEGLNKELIDEVKSTIMIKSLVMPAINIASDTVQLMGRGVPMADIVKSTPKKVAEVAAFVKGRIRRMEAEGELYVAQGAKKFGEVARLKSEIQAIHDMNTRLSIWPLIQAGEFGLIADVGNSRGDLDLVNGRMAQFLKKLTDKLPPAVVKAGNYALIGSDTPLYEGIQKTIEYGDFIMKALYYDHLMKRGVPDALGKVSEEFVNFDRSQGRFRGYMEQMGLMWFYNYKLRSAKIALSMVRDNPLQTILSVAGPIPSSIGLGKFLGDNIFGKVWEGNWINSIGPGMIFRAPGMQPLTHLLY